MSKSNLNTDAVVAQSLSASEGAMLPRPYCDSAWHTQWRSDGGFCPDCLSDWWATGGCEEPSDPTLYWFRIIARERASESDDTQREGWMDAAESAWLAFDRLSEATTISQQGDAFNDLANHMSDLATWLPGYDIECGRPGIALDDPEEGEDRP